MRMLAALLLAIALGGCGTYRNSFGGGGNSGDGDDVIIVRPPNVYSRGDVDAINAETQCRSLARSMLEAQRCGVRR